MAKLTEEQLEAGIGGGSAAVQFSWNFNTSVSAADPGSKKYSFNNATPSSVTQIYVNDTNNDNHDMSTIIAALKVGDKLYIQQEDDSTKFLLATISTIPTDNTGWFTIPVTIDGSGTLPSNNKGTVFIITYTSAGGAAQVVQTAHIQLSQSDIDTLNSTPIEIIPSNSGGVVNQIIAATAYLTHVSTGFTNGNKIQLIINSVVFFETGASFINAGNTRCEQLDFIGAGLSLPIGSVSAVSIKASTDASDGGTSKIDVYIQYVIIDTN